jgi:molecular chaperone GrpE
MSKEKVEKNQQENQNQEQVKEQDAVKNANEQTKSDPDNVPYEDYKKIMEQFEKALATIHHLEDLNRYYKAEYDKAIKYRSQVLSELLLNSLDGFQLAFKNEPSNEEAKRYRSGFEFIFKFIKDALAQEGVSEILPKVGDQYEPKIHQAMETIEVEDVKKNATIAEVLINGYMLKDRLLRPANVKIYTLKKQEKETTEKVN